MILLDMTAILFLFFGIFSPFFHFSVPGVMGPKKPSFISAASLLSGLMDTFEQFVSFSTSASGSKKKRVREDNSGQIGEAANQLHRLLEIYATQLLPSAELIGDRLSAALLVSQGDAPELWAAAGAFATIFCAGASALCKSLLDDACNCGDLTQWKSIFSPAQPKAVEHMCEILEAALSFVPTATAQRFAHCVAKLSTALADCNEAMAAGVVRLMCATVACLRPCCGPLLAACCQVLRDPLPTKSSVLFCQQLNRLRAVVSCLQHPLAVPFFVPLPDTEVVHLPERPALPAFEEKRPPLHSQNQSSAAAPPLQQLQPPVATAPALSLPPPLSVAPAVLSVSLEQPKPSPKVGPSKYSPKMSPKPSPVIPRASPGLRACTLTTEEEIEIPDIVLD